MAASCVDVAAALEGSISQDGEIWLNPPGVEVLQLIDIIESAAEVTAPTEVRNALEEFASQLREGRSVLFSGNELSGTDATVTNTRLAQVLADACNIDMPDYKATFHGLA